MRTKKNLRHGANFIVTSPEVSSIIESINGFKAWFKHNKLHNETGPAAIYPDGKKDYYINGFSIQPYKILYPHIIHNEINFNDKNLYINYIKDMFS